MKWLIRVDGGEEEDPTLEKAAGMDMVLNRRSVPTPA
jgi:hypothetical protein